MNKLFLLILVSAMSLAACGDDTMQSVTDAGVGEQAVVVLEPPVLQVIDSGLPGK